MTGGRAQSIKVQVEEGGVDGSTDDERRSGCSYFEDIKKERGRERETY